MAKEPRVQRSKADLRGAFKEQVSLLVSYCNHFDGGERKYSKPMATALRVMVHQSRHAQSALGLLGIRSGRFFTVSPSLNPRNLLSECNLVGLSGTVAGAGYVPILDFTPGDKHRVPFPEWWTNPIAKAQNGETMSRMDIVLSVADTDGGAHIDQALSPKYKLFRSGEFFGWYFLVEGKKAELIDAPEYACVRAIAHELLLTLQRYAPWSFEQPYFPIAASHSAKV